VKAKRSQFSTLSGVCYKRSQDSGAARVTVDHSTETDRGRHRHTRITIHRMGPGNNNPFQEYDSFTVLRFVQDSLILHIG